MPGDLRNVVEDVRETLNCWLDVDLRLINRDHNQFANALARQGRWRKGLSLYHRGLDLPNWLKGAGQDAGFPTLV